MTMFEMMHITHIFRRLPAANISYELKMTESSAGYAMVELSLTDAWKEILGRLLQTLWHVTQTGKRIIYHRIRFCTAESTSMFSSLG